MQRRVHQLTSHLYDVHWTGPHFFISLIATMKPSTDKPMTIRLPEDVAGQLQKLVETTGRNKNAITVAALRDYLEAHASHIEEIEQGVAEADRGEFATDSEVNSAFAKYGA